MAATAANLAPPNDSFADAQPLVGAAGSTRGTNVGASLEDGEPEHYLYARVPAQSSVWYKWTAPSAGWATFETCGSRFDSVLAVYTGPAESALSQLRLVTDDRDTDDTCEPASRVRFETAARAVYWIAVAGHTGEGAPTGDFTLAWSRQGPKPPAGGCFFSTKGALRWCLGTNYGYSWSPCWAADVDRVDSPNRYWVQEGNTVLGYVRPAGPGRWRAMVAVYGGWARGGTIVRAKGGRWIVRTFRGKSLGFARGPYPVAIGAYRLLAGNC
jgi:hypothetical protein